MRTIDPATELPDDLLLRWASRDPLRTWASDDGRAFAAACAGLSRHDRLVVHGPAESLVPLVEKALAEVGPTYRPLGERRVIAALAAGLPRLRIVADFGWMDRAGDPAAPAEPAAARATAGAFPTGAPAFPTGTSPYPNGTAAHPGGPSAYASGTAPYPSGTAPVGTRSAEPGTAHWLAPAQDPEVAELLLRSFPSSYAIPGAPGVQRWAGVRDGAGRLVAVGAHAWSAPGVGFLAGIAVDREARGRGLGRTVFGFVLDEALASYGTAALMVDDANDGAIALYRAAGFEYRPVSAAAVIR